MELGKNYLLLTKVWSLLPKLARKVGDGYSWEFLAGVCLTLFQTKKCYFPYLFSDQTSKIHTRFQTLPLGRNYVIITQSRAQTKNFFKRISNSHISIQSLLFIWDLKDKYVYTLLQFPRKTIPDSRPKWESLYP